MGKYTLDEPRFELKPCPFCGGKAIYIEDCHENSDTTQKHSVGCPACEVSFSSYISYWSRDYKDEMAALVEKWNKRATCKPENSPVDERKADEGIIGRIEELECQIKYFKGWVGDLQELCNDLKMRMDNNAVWHKDVDVAQEELDKRIDDLYNTKDRYSIQLDRLANRIAALEEWRRG